MKVNFKTSVTDIYSRVAWQLVADPLGTVRHTLGTTALELFEIQGRGVLAFKFSGVH